MVWLHGMCMVYYDVLKLFTNCCLCASESESVSENENEMIFVCCCNKLTNQPTKQTNQQKLLLYIVKCKRERVSIPLLKIEIEVLLVELI